jgi:sulfur carrier protein
MPISIILNGATTTLPRVMNIDEFMQHLSLSDKRVAIERNLEIVPRARYGEVKLQAGDRLEVVSFIGGG